MFRRARLSVKPNVRPGVSARGSTAPNLQRGQQVPRAPEPAVASASKPAESTNVLPVDFGEAEPQEKAPRSSDEKTDGENYVEESSKSSSTVSQRRKRTSSIPTLVKPSVSVPSEPHPLSTVNQEAEQPNPIPTKEKQPCSDRYRIYKAQKLREMLKEELRKEKKQWKNKYAINESQRPPDRSKMTMRDFIYYLPDNNPMSSSLEQEKKTEKSLTPAQTREQEGKSIANAEDNEEIEEEMDDGPLLVPRVKVAEDGSIILDEESLTVEVLRTKGPCVVEENDPIFERGSTTTYSSFRKNYYSKPWSNKETDMFFLAISMVGTDFSMIGQLFPHRARIEIKNKFKREEKTNGWRIDKAFQEKRPFDFDFFAHLLQKVLAEEEKRKQKSIKSQTLKEKKSCKPRKNVKVKKVASEGVNDDPDESMSTKISDKEVSQKDAQTVEEQQSLTSAGQDSEQIALEPDLNQKKRKKNHDEVGKKEVNLSGNATTVQPGPSKGGKNKITETSESSTLDLPSSEAGIRTLCEANNADSSCTEERNVDLKNKALGTDQTENVKPVLRGQLQRPKPNLSRAVGKKSVLSQGKIDAERKSLHPETSVEKEGDQPKAFRPSRLMRGRLQRPKPNIGKATERKEVLASQEKMRATEEKNENESCIDRDTSAQIEDWSYKNFECEEIMSQSEKKDNSFKNIQSDEPKAVSENLSIQEESNADILKQAPVLKTQFQKLNIERRTGTKEISSKEEVPEEILASGEMTGDLREVERQETSPREDNTTKEMESALKETGRVMSPRENIPEVIDISVEMETDSQGTAREIFSREKIPNVTDATKGQETDLEEAKKREMSLHENAPEEVSSEDEREIGLKETERELSPREETAEMTDAAEDREKDLEETGRREIPTREKASKVKTVGKMETDVKEIGEDVSPTERVLVGIGTIRAGEIDLTETGKRDIFMVENVPGKMIVTEEKEGDLKETETEISLRKSGSEDISATEEMVVDLKKTDISLRENEPEEPGTSRQTETDLRESSSGNCSAMPSLNTKACIFLSFNNFAFDEVLSMVRTSVEEKRNSEEEVSSQSSHLKTSLQTSELDETVHQGIQSPDVPEKFSDINLSKSLPQEQKPFEVKPAPLVRSRFKRLKPNLAKAALKKEIVEAEKYVPGKKLETSKRETIVIKQNSEQMNTLLFQHDVASLMTSGEKDKSGHREEEPGILPCIQTEKDPSPLSSCVPKEESQSTQAQEKELAVSMGTYNINTYEQEVKEGVTQTAQSVRDRLQRPRPNVRKAGQKQIEEKGEAKGIIKEEGTILQKDGTKEKFLTVPNSQVGTDIKVVSSKVSEGGIYENQSHMVLLENLHVNKIDVVDENMRHEHKTYVPSPAQLVRKQFQEAKPNLGRTYGKKKEPGIEKDRADQTEAWKPEDNLLQQGDSDIQLLQKEKAEFLTSQEASVRKDCVGAREAGLAKKNAHSEVGLSGSVGEKTTGDNSVSSSVVEEHLSKLTSCPQLFKEPNYAKISLGRRTTISFASKCEIDHCERRMHRKIKPNVTKGRGSKRIRSKTPKKEPRASRAVLVTLRAPQEEDEDDAEYFDPDYEEENYHLAPEEVNKAPVFVPIGLRSPEPVPSQIEETMEELEINVNVPDVGCIGVVEQLSNTDEMTTGEHTQDETGTNDGSTEAAITLLTMGDLVLQSEISTEQSDGVCVLPDVHSKDTSQIPFSPDNINHKIGLECQELSSSVNSTSLSLEENKIILEEQSAKEEMGTMEKIKENALSTRNTTSEVTSNLKMRSGFAKPQPNLKKILGTSSFDAHQEGPSLFIEGEVEIQRETEKHASKATGLQNENLGSVTTEGSKEQNKWACAHGIEETSISQDRNLIERNEDQEEGSQEVQILSVAPIVFSETRPHTHSSGRGLSESSIQEPLRKDSTADSVLTFHSPECTPTSIPEVLQENIINPQDVTVTNIRQDGEDEQAFILTLVEIPTNAVEEFTDTTTQLMPNSLLPAPILVKSVNMEERGDMSMNFPVSSVVQDDMCLSNSGRDDSEKPPANLDLISRKRFHCRLDASDHVPPAKKSPLTLRNSCQKHTSEACAKKLNVFEETGEPNKGQDIFPTSGNTPTTLEPQEGHLEATFQSIGSRSSEKITDMHREKNTPQLPQDEVIVSDKEERTHAAARSEQRDCIASSSKTPLSRPGRRPLGFLSLICSKNSLESDEPTQVHIKKRLKPLIPVSRQNLKRSNPLSESQNKGQESPDFLPSPSVVVNTQSEKIGTSLTQVSCDRSLPKEECKSGQNQASEEEPTTVSEYFFNDIFIEVDETE
ncbi:hypothetical protein MC885_008210 [Smutsia gigantea]|nr:hypothetical protein MC885_008210 [Smutsia gigantea]